MPFEAEDPPNEATLEAAALQFVSDAYIYLFLVVTGTHPVVPPIAKIPLVLFPDAAPASPAMLEAVAEPLVSQAYVYLLRVVDAAPTPLIKYPKANIPLVLFPVDD